MRLTFVAPSQPQTHTHASVKDRALNYGDGFFSTMRCVHHSIELLHMHVQRLQNDASRLGFHIDNWDELIQNLEDTAQQGPAESVIKVLISRGEGGRGYSSQSAVSPMAFITQTLLPPNPIHLRVSVAQGFLAEQPLLAGIKHLNRLEQVLFKRQADELELDDVICLDIHQHVIETSSANLFWFKDGRWYTPELTRCGVNGIYRQFILAVFKEFNVTCIVGDFPLHQLIEADSVFACNAVRGVLPISELRLSIHRKHHEMKNVQSILNDQMICFRNSQLPIIQQLVEQQLERVEPALSNLRDD